jgi:hypothetical protein
MTIAALYKQADYKRVISAAKASGLKISSMELDPTGRIFIHFDQPQQPVHQRQQPVQQRQQPVQQRQHKGKTSGWDGLGQILDSPTSSANLRTGTVRKG